jgi:hypothetical protein
MMEVVIEIMAVVSSTHRIIIVVETTAVLAKITSMKAVNSHSLGLLTMDAQGLQLSARLSFSMPVIAI